MFEWWAWAAFLAFVGAMLALDLFVLHRDAHEVSMREAATWSGVWVALGLGFGAVLWAWQGTVVAEEYLAGYLIEKALSVDNVFVFALIFSYFAVPPRYQHRVLMWGILGALVMRGAFILAGAALLDAFHATIYVFGAILLVTAVKILRHGSAEIHPERNPMLRLVRRVLPVASGSGAKPSSSRSTACGWPPPSSPCWCSSRPPTSSSPSTRSRPSSP